MEEKKKKDLPNKQLTGEAFENKEKEAEPKKSNEKEKQNK
jgi:hypothetical protein